MEEGSRGQPGGWFAMDNRIVDECDLNAYELAILTVLCRCRSHETGKCHPSSAYLSKHTKLSRPTVLKAVKALEQKGLLTVTRPGASKRGRANEYTVLLVPGSRMPGASTGKAERQEPVNAASIPCQRGLHRQDLINKTQQNKKECGDAAAPPAPIDQPGRNQVSRTEEKGHDPNLDHPAVMAYRSACRTMPNRTQRAAIAAEVGDLDRWLEVLKEWLLVGYRPTNVAGMLDWYNKGIPERSKGDGRHGKAGRSGRGMDKSVEWGSYESTSGAE